MKSRSEASISKEIMVLAPEGTKIFRNNVGLFLTKDGRRVRTGLCVGSSDLIGWTSVKITEDMVGQEVAVFTAIEVKKETGRASPEQLNFINVVTTAGGIAGVCRSAEDVKKLIDTYYNAV